MPRAQLVLPNPTVLQCNQPALHVPRTKNQMGVVLPLPQQSQQSEYWGRWDYGISEHIQRPQFSPEIAVLDSAEDAFIPATQY